MNPLVIDTHVFIWWNTKPELLSTPVLAALTDPANTLYLSVISIWEMQIKIQLGKLSVLPSLSIVVETNRTVNRVQLLSLTSEHIYRLDALPSLH